MDLLTKRRSLVFLIAGLLGAAVWIVTGSAIFAPWVASAFALSAHAKRAS